MEPVQPTGQTAEASAAAPRPLTAEEMRAAGRRLKAFAETLDLTERDREAAGHISCAVSQLVNQLLTLHADPSNGLGDGVDDRVLTGQAALAIALRSSQIAQELRGIDPLAQAMAEAQAAEAQALAAELAPARPAAPVLPAWWVRVRGWVERKLARE